MVDNRSATFRQPIEDLFTAHDWSASIVDGRDHDRLAEALRAQVLGRPHLVVADVTRGDS